MFKLLMKFERQYDWDLGQWERDRCRWERSLKQAVEPPLHTKLLIIISRPLIARDAREVRGRRLNQVEKSRAEREGMVLCLSLLMAVHCFLQLFHVVLISLIMKSTLVQVI